MTRPPKAKTRRRGEVSLLPGIGDQAEAPLIIEDSYISSVVGQFKGYTPVPKSIDYAMWPFN